MSQRMLSCRFCKKITMHHLKEPNHVVHLVLSCVTAGIWLVVWGYVAWQAARPSGRAHCTACGGTYIGYNPTNR